MGQRSLALMLAVMAALAIVSCGNDTDTAVTTTISTTTALSTTEATTTSKPTTSTSTTSTSTTGTTTTTTQPTVDDVVLSADGLGVVDFGTEVEEALVELVRVLGPPTLDTGWGDPFEPDNEPLWPGCPGTIARVVAWEEVLGVVLTDWNQDSEDYRASIGTPYFAGAGLWPNSPVPAVDGAMSGDTVGELRAIYGDRLLITRNTDGFGPRWLFAIDDDTIAGPLDRAGGLRGSIEWPGYADWPPTAPTVAPDATTVTDDYVAAGFTAGVSCDSP